MRRTIVCVLGVLISSIAARPAFLPPQYLPVYGGASGTAFTKDCGSGYVLTGIRFRSSVLVDAIGILCRPVNANGSLGPETTVGSLSGGGGGTSGSSSCEAGTVAAGAGVGYGTWVSQFAVWCRPWIASSRSFGGSKMTETSARAGTSVTPANWMKEYCEASTQPVRAIRGRSAGFVDAIGVTCNEP